MKTSKLSYLSESEGAITARLIAEQRRRRQEQAKAQCAQGTTTDEANSEQTGDAEAWPAEPPLSIGPCEHRLFDVVDLHRAMKHATSTETRGALAEFRELGCVRRLTPVPADYTERCRELSEEFPQFSEALFGKIVPELAIGQFGGRGIKFPNLCLQGSPGVGKTYFTNRLAEVFGLPFTRINLEGAQGGFCINGLDRSYSNHAPGEIVRFLTQGRHDTPVNGVVALEEVDKASGDSRFSVENTLLQLLEETTAKEFRDLSIPELKIDITSVNFIFTANILERISAPVLSRLEKIELPELTPMQSTKIAEAQFNKLIKQLNLQAANLVLTRQSLTTLSAVSPREQKGLLRSAIGVAIHGQQTEVAIRAEPKSSMGHRPIGFI